jgi:formyl-CoA transferase/CoA:oxalate CoA-transferase
VSAAREPQLPLAGIRVLDLTQYVSGPFCTMLLAELGAEVVKVEPPVRGDIYRVQGPSFLGGVSTSFLSVNRSKRSLTLDLKHRAAIEVVERLVENVDVLVENFKPGTAERLGVGYEQLREINPQLVYCSISGYGQDGPDAARGGYDLMAQARGGLMAMTGHVGDEPTKVGLPVLDLASGIYAALGAVSALWNRDRGGGGSHVDVSLLDTAVSFLPMALTEYQANGRLPEPIGSASPFFAPYEGFRTRDGYITVVGTGGKDHWERFCEVLGLEQLLDDGRFKTNVDRVANRDELHRLVEEVLVTRSSSHWVAAFGAAGLPCEPVQNLDALIADPQIEHRGMMVRYQHPDVGAVLASAIPLVFGGATRPTPTAPPRLGEHTREILASVGFSADEITSLAEDGAI